VVEVSLFFLQAHNQSNNFYFISCTDHKYRIMLSIWGSKHMVSCTDVPFGVTTFIFNIFPYFFSKNAKIRAKIGTFKVKW